MLNNTESFAWLAEKMHYTNKIISGRYLIKNGMNNRELVSLLRSGKQTPVSFTFNNIRTKKDLVTRVSSQLEVDSVEFLSMLNDDSMLSKIGFTLRSGQRT